MIETFQHLGLGPDGLDQALAEAEARPILHISTADPNDGHELIDPRQIANGYGDSYLVALNYLLLVAGDAAYMPPAGRAEPLPQRVRLL